jgi:hypothetical protein
MVKRQFVAGRSALDMLREAAPRRSGGGARIDQQLFI